MVYDREFSVTVEEKNTIGYQTTKVSIPQPYDILLVSAILRNRETQEEIIYNLYEGSTINDK